MIQIPLTREQFEAKTRALRERHGLELTGDQGTISKSGVTARYSFNGSSLIVEVLEKPFFVSESYCEDQLRAFLGT